MNFIFRPLFYVLIIKISISITFCQVLPSFNSSFSNQSESDSLVIVQIQKVGFLYTNNDFEKGLELTQDLFQNSYLESSIKVKESILELGIKLSFALDYREITLSYLESFYLLNPKFSPTYINQITPQLESFIYDFIQTKSKNSIFVNKIPQNIEYVPSTVIVYTDEDIRRLGSRDLLDLLRLIPGFAEIGDNNERIFGTRGSTGTSLQDVLILINGHRITDNLTSTSGPDWLSLDYVDQIEIVRGPGSAIHGGSAFSGVVNIITKTGADLEINEVSAKIGNGNNFESISDDFSQSYKFNYQYSRRISNYEGFYLSATYNQSGGSLVNYEDSEYKIVLPEENIRAADTLGNEYINRYGPGYNFLFNYNNKSFRLTANAQSNNYYLARPGSFNLWQTEDKDSLSHQRRRIDKREFIQLEKDLLQNVSPKKSLLMKTSIDHFQKDFFIPARSFGIESSSRLMGDEYRATLSVDFSSSSLLGEKGLQNHVLVGLETYVTGWNYSFLTENAGVFLDSARIDQFSSPGDSRTETNASLYAQTEQDIIKDRLVSTVGVRFNYQSEFSTFEKFEFGKNFSPRFALIYLSKKDLSKEYRNSVKFIYNSAFMPPPFLYRKGGITGFVGSRDLKPITLHSFELGSSFFFNSSLNFNLQTYVNQINDYIRRQDDKYVNSMTAIRMMGFEAELTYKRIPENDYKGGFNYHLFSNYSNSNPQTASEDSYEEDQTSQYPKHIMNFGSYVSFKKNTQIQNKNELSSNLEDFLVSLSTTAQFTGYTNVQSEYSIANDGHLVKESEKLLQSLPTGFILNAHLNIMIRRLNLGISVFNLLNKEYFLSSLTSPIRRQRGEGRMFYLNLGYNLAK